DSGLGVRPFVDDGDRAAVDQLEASLREHPLDGIASATLGNRCLTVARRRELDHLSEVAEQADVLEAPPEREAEPAGRRENPTRLDQGILTPLPDPVEARRHVERPVVEWQSKHVAYPEVTRWRPRHGDIDQRTRTVDAADGGPEPPGELGGEAGAAGDVE